ncbi:MAG: hypothetical protein HY922_14655 [Elusimicrobia bacterium]|nr:hypothetical protein [Elusimicrobiota bacterium]
MRTLFLAALVAAALAYAYRSGKNLDGTAWDVKLKPDSFFAFSRKDTLVFEDGLLTVAGYAKKGFAPAAYGSESAGAEGGKAWQASMDLQGGGTSQWQGVARGDRIEGTVLWQETDGRTKRYTFKGRRKTI